MTLRQQESRRLPRTYEDAQGLIRVHRITVTCEQGCHESLHLADATEDAISFD